MHDCLSLSQGEAWCFLLISMEFQKLLLRNLERALPFGSGQRRKRIIKLFRTRAQEGPPGSVLFHSVVFLVLSSCLKG